MFNQDTDMTADVAAIMTMEDILGKSVSEATVLSRKLFPDGYYVMNISDHEWKEYTITNSPTAKNPNPREGANAPQLNLVFTILGYDTSGQQPYKYLTPEKKFVQIKKANLEDEVGKYVGDSFTHTIFFGRDGLPNKDGSGIMTPGQNELRTILSKFIGEKNAAEAGVDLETSSFGELLTAATQLQSVVPMKNEIDYRDPTRVNALIDLLGEFLPIDPAENAAAA